MSESHGSDVTIGTITWASAKRLRTHIFDVFTKIFERRRFGFKVQRIENELRVQTQDDMFAVVFQNLGSEFGIVVNETADLESDMSFFTFPSPVYFNKFDVSKMKSVKSIGTTIANKLKNRPMFKVTSQ